MRWLLVQRLQKSRMDRDRTTGLQDAQDFRGGSPRRAQMFEDVKGEDVVESVVTKRKGVCVTHHIGVSENLTFEFDAIGILVGGCAGPDMENQALTPEKDGFELFSHRIASVRRRDGDDSGRIWQKNRHAMDDREFSAASRTLKQARRSGELTPARRAGKESREIWVHLAGAAKFRLVSRRRLTKLPLL